MEKYPKFILFFSKLSKEWNKPEKQMLCEPNYYITYSLTPWHSHGHINNHTSFFFFIFEKYCEQIDISLKKMCILLSTTTWIVCLALFWASGYRIFVLPIVETITRHLEFENTWHSANIIYEEHNIRRWNTH